MALPKRGGKPKQLHLQDDVIKNLTKMAVDQDTTFKLLAEEVLTEKSKEADKKSKK